MLKQKEGTLLADMTTQLHKSHAEMQRQTFVAVKEAVSEVKADIARVEGDRQHVVNALAEAMNEVTRLRNKREGYEYLDEEQVYGEYGSLSHWYVDAMCSRDAAGVGKIDNAEKGNKGGCSIDGATGGNEQD